MCACANFKMVTMVTRMMEEGLMVAEEICDLFVFQKEQKLARPSSPPPRARKRWCVQNPKVLESADPFLTVKERIINVCSI